MFCLEAFQDSLEDGVGVVSEAPIGVGTACMVRRPGSSRTRVTYRRDLYGVSFLAYLWRCWAAAAMRWACHS